MFSTAEKAHNVHVSRQQQKPNTSFFRKAGEDAFFGGNQSSSFFSSPVQAKLSVSSPDDPQEKEADAVAEQVMRMPEPVAVSGKEEERKVQTKSALPVIHRNAEESTKEEVQAKALPHIHRSAESQTDTENRARPSEAFAPPLVYRKPIALHRSAIIQRTGRAPPQEDGSFHEQLASKRGGGSALPSGTQQFMESRFGADFSGVRVHTGSYASEMSSSIQAQAFTHGNDIYFNQGKYSPDTPSGGALLAHELTHTIQQGASPASSHIVSAKRQSGIIQRSFLNESVLSQIDLEGRSGGKPLSKEAKEYLEGYYHTNLDDIRLHSDYEIANACRAAGVNAFVKGKDIAVVPWRINMDTEEGAVLLSEQVAKSLKQRGIHAVGSDGNDVGIVALLLNQIRKAVEENKLDQARADLGKRAPSTPLAPPVKDKKATEKKTVSGKEKKGAAGKIKGKGRKGSPDGPSFKPAKAKKGQSPSKPSEDPAFLRVVANTKSTAKGQKDHEPAEKKSEEAQKSAVAVPKEAEGKAQNRKTDGMGTATTEDKPFDAASFKKELLKKIEEITPKNLEEADEFKENNKIDNVKTTVNEKVEGGKKATTGPVEKATAQPLQVNPTDNKQPVPLPPTPAGPKPIGPGAQNAVPKNKTGEEISMQEQSSSLDEEMKKNNVTEGQLKTSNEPTFAEALNEKQAAQKDAIEKPKQYKKEEAVELKAAKAEATQDAAKSLTVMHGARGKNFAESVQQQQTAKKKDEDARTKVTNEIDRLYGIAEVAVKKALEEADTQSNSLFDKGAQEAQQEFEDYVDRKMRAYKADRYSGFWGGLRWAKDKIFGMPDAVNEFYTEGRQLYLNKMDKVITDVAEVVTNKLNEAKQAIKDGKKSIDDYVTQLPKDLQSVGKEAADSIQDKFDSLEQSVNDKRDGLIDGLAKKYVDNVKKLDERIEELKEANQGLIDKAIGFLKKVWKVIKDLYNLFTTILAKLAAIIGVILDNPGGFFENVGKAFRKGFDQFKAKFMDYLEQGLMDWLAANLGVAGIELPKEFSASAILTLVLQVMGITKQHIRERAIGILGERKVKRLEQAGGLLFKIYNEGLGALWDLIVEKITDFKEIIWEAIKSYIKTAIIEAAIVFILSLLNPIGAFVKVCMAIYDFLMMLVRFKDRIIELLDTILGAVTDIASGAIDTAATAIEKAFAKSIPIIIAFLAALLHLNDIAVKVRNIITRIRARVDKAIDFAISKAWSFIGKGVDSVLGLEDKGKEMVREAIGGGGPPQEKLKNALQDGQEAVNRYAGKRVGRVILTPLLAAIRLKYGLQTLEVIPRGATWAVRGVINPEGEVETLAQVDTPTDTANETVEKTFKLGEETHIIRGEVVGQQVVFKMASATFADLQTRLLDIDRFHTARLIKAGNDKRAEELRVELRRIMAHTQTIEQRLEKNPNAGERARAILNAIDGLSSDLAGVCQRFGIKKIVDDTATYKIPPEHSPTYGPVNPDGQASFASATLSWKTRQHMRSTNPEANVGGMNIRPGYHRGHLLAASLGGSNAALGNFAPMSATTNTSIGGMVLGEGPLRRSLNAEAYPPYIIGYHFRCKYDNDRANFQTWLAAAVGAGPAAAVNLYRLARRNENLSPALVLANVGGTATLATITANYDSILDKLLMHYMPTKFTMTLTIEQGENLTLPSVGSFQNHQ